MPHCDVTVAISWRQTLRAMESVTWRAAILNDFNPKDFCEEDVKQVKNVASFLETYFPGKNIDPAG
jgi:hypothetical protein